MRTGLEVIESPSRTIGDPEFIYGEGGDDLIFGFSGDDYLMGGTEDDVLIGGLGNDQFIAGPDDDFMAGGAGDDIYYMDSFGPDLPAENIFIGNDGSDTVVFEKAADEYLINQVTAQQITALNNLLNDREAEFLGYNMPDLQFDTSLPVIRVDYLTDAGRQTDFLQADLYQFDDTTLEFVQPGGSGDFFLTSIDASVPLIYNGGGRPVQELGANNVLGTNQDDRLIGGDGDDDLRGSDGNDTLVSFGGAASLDGGSGDDTLVAMSSTPQRTGRAHGWGGRRYVCVCPAVDHDNGRDH